MDAARPLRSGLIVALAAGLALPAAAPAQQFVTDDVGVVDHRACQLEAWHGGTASWVLPACSPIRNVELTAGFGFVAGEDGRDLEYVVQLKATLREPGEGGPGVGFVAGAGLDPLAQATGRRVPGIFAYVPLTVPLAEERLLLHANLGWQGDRLRSDEADRATDLHHSATWGLRADARAGDRVAVIAEVFGEDSGPAEIQVGVRAALIAGLIHVDLSYGTGLVDWGIGTRWVLGLAITPATTH
jgi:hypothetical protein